eukprot:10368_1
MAMLSIIYKMKNLKKDKMAKNTPKSDTSTNTTTRKATISNRCNVNDANSCGDEVKEEQHRSKENKHKNVVTSGSLFSGGNDENLNGEQKMKHKIQIINKKNMNLVIIFIVELLCLKQK